MEKNDTSRNTEKYNTDSTKRPVSNKAKKRRRRIHPLLPVFVLGFVICFVIIIRNAIDKKNSEDIYSDMQDSATEHIYTGAEGSIVENTDVDIATDTVTESDKDILTELGIEIPEKSIDWDALYEVNDDIYAWIFIPGTAIDYPILQHKTEQDFYLDHNVDGSAGYPGCIYTQIRNKKDFTDFATIIYGHDMLDGSMFQNLHNYEDSQFFDENKYIYIYTPDTVLVYQIFAAVTFHDRNIMLYYDFEENSGRAGYINDILACNSMTDQHSEDIGVSTTSHVVSLSTCIGSKPENRWIVSGVLLNEFE